MTNVTTCDDEATWGNRKYHGHRCLPPDILADLKKEFEKKYGGNK